MPIDHSVVSSMAGIEKERGRRGVLTPVNESTLILTGASRICMDMSTTTSYHLPTDKRDRLTAFTTFSRASSTAASDMPVFYNHH